MKGLMAILVAGSVAACGSPGSVTFTTYGEDFIEQGIPASEFEDEWAVKFDRFLVNLGEMRLAQSDGTVGAEVSATKTWDVTKPGPVVVATVSDVADAKYPDVSYAIAPSDALTAGNASEADVALMKDGKYSVYVEGKATKGTATKTFKWGFTSNTLLENCMNEDGEHGVVVPSGGDVKIELTIHGDHLFLDDLQSEESVMRFDEMAAADANDDGEVTLEELAAVDLTTLGLDRYGTGNVANVENLRDFISSQVRTLGHYRGEGECSPRSR